MEEPRLNGKRLEHIALVSNSQEISGEFHKRFFHEYKSRAELEDMLNALGKIASNTFYLEADEDIFDELKHLRDRNELDLVFNISNGFRGESRESQVTAMLEFLGIPHTGGGVLNTALSLDKAKTKELLAYHGVPIAPFQVVSDPDDVVQDHLKFPLFLKPLNEGSSMGVTYDSKVEDIDQLRTTVAELIREYEEPVLIETFLPGREFSIGLLGDELLPIDEKVIGEVGYQAVEIKFFGRKKGLMEYVCPVENMPPELETKLRSIAKTAFEATYCQDVARIDYRCDAEGNPYLLEINSPACIVKGGSSIELEASVAGYSYDELIKKIVTSAVNRYNGVPYKIKP
jgi:D-alanine-D-alanine ligase